ncbi:MAG: hypothetical protein KDJ16_10205 [Hyphomicrobiales bacterium]|nr:hypothetical protein [Hyphomicrobiales bacterium]
MLRPMLAAILFALSAAAATAEDDAGTAPSAPIEPATAEETVKIRQVAPPQKPDTAQIPEIAEKAAAMPAAKPKRSETATAADANVIYRDNTKKHCIGGVACPSHCADSDRACEAEFSYVIELDKPTYIAAIQLNAHDNIGKTRRSKLVVKVNGKTVDEQPVYRLGSSVSLKADTVGQIITIESAHQYNGFLRGGDEAMIWDVFVFGHAVN